MPCETRKDAAATVRIRRYSKTDEIQSPIFLSRIDGKGIRRTITHPLGTISRMLNSLSQHANYDCRHSASFFPGSVRFLIAVRNGIGRSLNSQPY